MISLRCNRDLVSQPPGIPSILRRRPLCFRLAYALWLQSIIGLIIGLACQHREVKAEESSHGGQAPSVKQPAKTGRSAYVSVSKALVYSGPSEEHYPTGQLTWGSAVEVFHRTDSGWAAIRPPKNSFSWVVASDAYLLPGGRTIEITGGNAVSWVGSALGTPKQYRWQVKLNSGEQLIVLGEEIVEDAEGNEKLWYQISPPSGEFRWIQAGLLSEEPPPRVAAESNASQDSAVVPAKASASEEDSSASVQSAQFQEEIIVGSIDGQVVDGQIIEGEVIAGEVIDGGVIYQDMPMGHSGVVEISGEPVSDSSWTDWQLFEFTDHGLRFPLWERALNRRALQHDPLLHDPFSLAMTPKIKGPVRPTVIHEPPLPSAPRRRTPWRDPRMLGELRRSGYPQAQARRGSGTTFSALQEAWSGANAADRQSHSDDYWSFQPRSGDDSRPKLAPKLDDSAAWHGFGGGASGDRFHLASSSEAAPIESSSAAVMQLQIQLSDLVTQPMIQWNFAELKEQVRQLIQAGNSPLERGHARLLMERIEDFEQLAVKSGYFIASTNNSTLPSMAYNVSDSRSPVQPASYSSDQRSARDESSNRDGFVPRGGPHMSFDASGWLVPVHAATVGQPTHAITDDSGKIVAYVTGLPGMNLDRYINQAVGIHGLRGFLPQFQAAHIEAQNVTRLR